MKVNKREELMSLRDYRIIALAIQTNLVNEKDKNEKKNYIIQIVQEKRNVIITLILIFVLYKIKREHTICKSNIGSAFRAARG